MRGKSTTPKTGCTSETTQDSPTLDIVRLIGEHHADVFRYAYRLSGNNVDSEDLTQQTFLIAHQKIDQLRKIQLAVRADLETSKKRREARFKQLIKIYSNMKPKDAARVFDELPLAILLDLVGGMKEGNSAPILAAMNSDKARQVTAGLAARARRGRLKAAPKQ